MSSRVWSTLVCTLIAISTIAQEHKCGFDHWVDKLAKEQPQFFEQLESIEDVVKRRHHARNLDEHEYRIPVVCHVLHRGEAIGQGPNISDKQISSAIQSLNDAFAGRANYKTPDARIRFELAKIGPDCQQTSGIVRVNAASICANGDCYRTKGITKENELAVKQSSIWPTGLYLNIWVVAEIEDNDGKSGIQGFAQLPGFEKSTDGVVILHNALGFDASGNAGFTLKASTNLNAVLIHEVGHALGLYHSFEGDDIDRNGTGDRCPSVDACGAFLGDCVDDTPPHIRTLGHCDISDINVCDGGHSKERYIHNFMDYSSQECQYEFTAGQVDRMRSFAATLRRSWITSNTLETELPSPAVAADCKPKTSSLSDTWEMGVHSVTLGTHFTESGSAFEDGGYQDNWCNVWQVSAGATYQLTVFTGEQNLQSVKVFADYNSDGDFEDHDELLLVSEMAKTHQTAIKIPNHATKGKSLRLRVIADYPGFEIKDACHSPYVGQVEDFAMRIGAAAAGDVTDTDDQQDPVDTDSEDDTDPVEAPIENEELTKLGLKFTGEDLSTRLQFRWSVTNDAHIKRYYLERSRDGSSFSKLYSIGSRKKANAGYMVYDWRPQTFYRLRIQPKHGADFFSETLTFQSSSSGFELFPNPLRNESAISVVPKNGERLQTIELLDMSGKLIQRVQLPTDGSIPPSGYEISIPEIPRGLYLIRAFGEEQVMTKFVSQL